jgi:cytochrome c-type biogenesis protein CcsB
MTIPSAALLTVACLLLAVAVCAYAVLLLKEQRGLGRLGTALASAALLILTVSLVLRAVETQHWPLSNSYEFSMAFLWSAVAAYLLLERLTGTRSTGAFAVGMALAVAAYPLFLAPDWMKEVRSLVPALQTPWLPLHVATGALAYGALAVNCGSSVMYLTSVLAPRLPQQFPAPSDIEESGYRALIIAYPWMSLVLITGAIWAQMAWGSYWNWDIKETWTLATWMLYTLLFHLRVVRGWRGNRIAVLSILGFAMVIFTFLGVGWLARVVGLQSLHLY